MKRHILKFILSLVKALVIIKRLITWFVRTTGRFLVWVFRPAVPLIIIPLYQIIRRQVRHYFDLSENPWRRWWLLMSNKSTIVIVGTGLILLVTVGSVHASTASGVIVGSHSLLLSKILTQEIDWQAEDDSASGDVDFIEQIPTTVYDDGGSIAHVFPYTGLTGVAPIGEGDVEPLVVESPTTTSTPTKVSEPIKRYVVQKGDTLIRIAKKFGVKIETILAANNLVSTATLRQGETVIVPTVDGIIYTVKNGGTLSDVAKKYDVTAKQIASANQMGVGDQLKKGQALIIPGVQPPSIPKAPVKPEKKPDVVVPPVENQPDPEPEPQPPVETEPVVDVTPTPMPTQPNVIQRPALAAGEKLLWPTRQRRITQYFSGGHPGIDLDGDYTDAVYAADDGTVTYSGWNNTGYGNMVLIDHGNGMVTRYGHNSKVFVAVGQQVSRGDTIAMVGTTGRSTGSHLHFEVSINGRRVNPIKYIR